MAAPSPRASLGRRPVCGRTEQRRPPVSKRYETKVRMVCGSLSYCCSSAQNAHEKCLYRPSRQPHGLLHLRRRGRDQDARQHALSGFFRPYLLTHPPTCTLTHSRPDSLVLLRSFGGLGCCSCRVRVCRCWGCCSLSVCLCVCDLLIVFTCAGGR